jgi:hypothetical protein
MTTPDTVFHTPVEKREDIYAAIDQRAESVARWISPLNWFQWKPKIVGAITDALLEGAHKAEGHSEV